MANETNRKTLNERMTDDKVREDLIQKMTDNLPVLRTKLSFTQEDIAEIIGVSRHTIISMENHKRPMIWTTYLSLVLVFSGNSDTKMLMKVLGVTTEELEEYLSPRKKEK